MCLGVPGKVLSMETRADGMTMGRVSFSGVIKEVCLDFVPEAAAGDYVVVHVGFAISRIDDVVEALQEVHESSELVQQARGEGEVVIALDGATLDQTTAEAIAEAAAVPGAMPPSSVSRDG